MTAIIVSRRPVALIMFIEPTDRTVAVLREEKEEKDTREGEGGGERRREKSRS